jgi:Mn-containing catalase
MMQHLFQAWGARWPIKYRDMLLETGTEEISHIEMLATAVALNLENALLSMQEAAADSNSRVSAMLGGMNPRHLLSAGLAAMPVDASGVPFDCSHVYASGNILADMYANVTAEATGRVLAVRLNMTDDPGMKDMLRFLISRDTMHQNQWLAVIEEQGGIKGLPIPNSHPEKDQLPEFTYSFMSTRMDNTDPLPTGRWTEGKSIDGHSEFTVIERMEPVGGEPVLGPARPNSGA